MEEKQMNASDTFEENYNERNIEIIGAHSIIKEDFENLSEKSIHENVSQKSILSDIQGEGANSIDQTVNYFIDNVKQTDSFYCNSCGVDNWFDCMCPDSDYETKSEKKTIEEKGKPNNYSDSEYKSPREEETTVGNKRELENKAIGVKEKPRNFGFNFGECESLFYTKRGLKLHTNTIHLKLKPYKCTECSASFAQKEVLKYHMNSLHLNIKPFKCEECYRSFASKPNLKEHINGVHLKKRPFNCSDCAKSFLLKTGLTTHCNSVHLKLKPYECGQCSSAFSLKVA